MGFDAEGEDGPAEMQGATASVERPQLAEPACSGSSAGSRRRRSARFGTILAGAGWPE